MTITITQDTYSPIEYTLGQTMYFMHNNKVTEAELVEVSIIKDAGITLYFNDLCDGQFTRSNNNKVFFSKEELLASL